MNDSSEEFEDQEELQDLPLTRNKAAGQTPGEMLREARLAHDYSVEDLCAQTKLSIKTVHALEDNDFQALSQPVFARGYYRQCAKVLDIDSDRLMAAYSASGGEAAPRPASPTALNVVPEDVTPSRWLSLGLIAGLVIALLVVGVVFLLLPDDDSADTTSSGDSTLLLSDNAGSDAGDSDSAGRDTPVAEQPSQATTASNDPADSDPQRMGGRNVNETLGLNASDMDSQASAPPPAEPQVDPNQLTVTFTGRSWVDVRDANGARLLNGIFDSGVTRDLDGTPPYKITLGYAPGVELSIGGQPVDVEAQTSGNATARLTVAARGT